MFGPYLTRKQAIAFGARYYFGRDCKYGHGGIRLLANNCCRECRRIESESWRKSDPEKAKASARKGMQKWRTKNHEESLKRAQLYKKRNPHKTYAEQRAQHYLHNREQYKERMRRWYKRDPEKAKALARKRRARLGNVEGSHTIDDVQAIYAQQNGMCAYCGETKNLHLDHKIPLARGGSNWPSNLQFLCRFHNISKHTKTDAEYREQMYARFVKGLIQCSSI